jgi:hypothetical protein
MDGRIVSLVAAEEVAGGSFVGDGGGGGVGGGTPPVPFASVPAMLAGTEVTPRFVAVDGSFGGVFWRCFCGERAVLRENSELCM